MAQEPPKGDDSPATKAEAAVAEASADARIQGLTNDVTTLRNQLHILRTCLTELVQLELQGRTPGSPGHSRLTQLDREIHVLVPPR